MLASGAAEASTPRVAVSDFTGPYAGKVRAGVVKALRPSMRVVGYDSAKAIVQGDIATGRRKRWTLRLAVKGVDGTPVEQRSYKLKKPAIDKKVATAIARDVGAAVRSTPEPKAGTQPAQGMMVAQSGGSLSDMTPTQRAAAEVPAPPNTSPSPAASPEATVAGTAAVVEAPAAARSERAPAISLGLGLGLEKRSISLEGPGAPNLPSYDSAFYSTLGFAAQAFPAELLGSSRGWARPIGLGVSYERAVGISSKVRDTGAKVDTSASRFEAGVGYRLRLGSEDRLIVQPGTKLGSRSFDLGAGSPLPSTSYTFWGFGADGDVRLWRSLSAYAGLWLDLGFGAGDLKALAKDASSLGLELDLGARVRLPWRMFAQAGLRYERFGLGFEGVAADGRTASGGSDGYMQLALGAGTAF